MCSIDLEPCEVWSETKRTARKLHTCDCCGGLIRPGRVYVVHFSMFHGEKTSEKMCASCLAVAEAFQADHGQRSVPSSMRELLYECVSDGDPESKRWQLHLLNMDKRLATRKRAEARAD